MVGCVSGERSATLISGDDELVAAVMAIAAATGRDVGAVGLDGALQAWRSDVVLVGADVASSVAGLTMPRRGQVFVVGLRSGEGLVAVSGPLAAPVIVLPGGGRWLSEVLGRGDGDTVAVRVAVVGGAGGVGTSTLAAGLACAVAAGGGRAALVDLDATGGGCDLLLGAERLPGWRWDRLRSARGQISDITGQVPEADGVTVVSMARTGETSAGRDAVAAVVDSLSRTHRLVVLDVGRSLDAGGREALRGADHTVLVSPGDVRGVAASRATSAAGDVRAMGVVVRRRSRAAVAPDDVAAALGLPLLGVLPDDSSLPQAAERGVPPLRAARRSWRRGCLAILGHVLAGPATEVRPLARAAR